MLTLQDVCHSRYLLYRGLTDAGFDAGRASLAVDVLLGPEPEEQPEPEPETFEPSEEDWDDYVKWADRIDPSIYVERDDPENISDRDVMTVTGCVG